MEVRCKASTQKMYRSVVERFIVPAYAQAVEREHITALHLELRDIPHQVNRVLEVGGKLFNLAEEWKLRTGGTPCRFVRKYRERFLTEGEFRRFGGVEEDRGAGAVAGISGGGGPSSDADGVPTERDRGD